MQDLGDVLWRGLLHSACAEQRAEGVARWAEHAGDDADLLPLLGDDAPLVRGRGGRLFVVEVRAVALVALQDRHRHTGGWPHGPVTVRAAMPVEEVLRRAADATPGLDAVRRAQVEQTAGRDLASRVDPPAADVDACRAYLTLLALGAVEHELQQVDPVTLLTAVQAAVHATQAVTPRPAPHLRVDGPDGPVAWVLRTPHWPFTPGRVVVDVPVPAPAPALDLDAHLAAATAGRRHHLDLSRRGLTELPPALVRLTWLEYLLLDENALTTLPDALAALDGLQELSLRGNRLARLPAAVGRLRELGVLDLADNALEELPDELCDLGELHELDLSRNALTRLPERIDALTSLRVLRLHGNRLTELPTGLGTLTGLRELHLGGNRIGRLPPELAGLTGLETLTGLDDEPVLDPGFVAENPGYWSATPQQVIAGVLAEQARRGR